MNTANIATRVHREDNVAVAVADIDKGDSIVVDGRTVLAGEDVPRGHKINLFDLEAGDSIIKYGQPIGVAKHGIAAGVSVHAHNVSTALAGHVSYRYQPALVETPSNCPEAWLDRTFRGYRRSSGRVGTRNEIWVLVTVGCVNRLAKRLADEAERRWHGRTDGIFAFPHPFGCSQSGIDKDRTKALITALCQHPNAGGILLVSLGCETNQATDILDSLPDSSQQRVRHLAAQNARDEFSDGLALIASLVDVASKDARSECQISDLCIGTKCGGSDGFSGITANPLVGSIADVVAQAQGRVLLSEVPEMFGAEHILMNRATSRTVYQATLKLIADFKEYFFALGEPIHDNPSPGNIRGGITTLEEKSLGAIQKSGLSPVTDVCQYGEIVRENGVALVEAPGNDAVSSTALVAAGANLVLFTTGRGTPLAPPVPTIKISSNAELAKKKPNWIDFDGSAYLSSSSRDNAQSELLDLILNVASGDTLTASERNDQREIAIWKSGVTL